MAAALDLCSGNRGVGMIFLADHIPQANLCRIKPQPLRTQIQQAFHDQDGNRQAHAAVGTQGDLIGDNGEGLVAIGRELIRTGQG